MKNNANEIEGKLTGNLRILGVGPEGVLLGVGRAEDEDADQENADNQDELDDAQHAGKEHQISALQGVSEGNPGEISKGEHKSKTLGGDVSGGQQFFLQREMMVMRSRKQKARNQEEDKKKHENLIEETIPNVECVEDADQDHRVIHGALIFKLLVGKANVDHNPANQTWPELTEIFPIKQANPGVFGASHPKIVNHHTWEKGRRGK